MARKKVIIPLPVEYWCKCQDWQKHQWQMVHHEMMIFCVFCGQKLEKEKRV